MQKRQLVKGTQGPKKTQMDRQAEARPRQPSSAPTAHIPPGFLLMTDGPCKHS